MLKLYVFLYGGSTLIDPVVSVIKYIEGCKSPGACGKDFEI
jgi:hypothetical protein